MNTVIFSCRIKNWVEVSVVCKSSHKPEGPKYVEGGIVEREGGIVEREKRGRYCWKRESGVSRCESLVTRNDMSLKLGK